MLSFEDLIKHLCHDCDVREIFSFASPVPPILFVPFIVAFRLRFTSTRRLDGLSLSLPLFFPFAPFVKYSFSSQLLRDSARFNFRCSRASPAYQAALSPSSAGLFRNRDYDLG